MSRSAKILVFATQYMPTGGIESHLREFCTHLSKAGVEVDLVITNSAMRPETEKLFREICSKVYLGKQKQSIRRLVWLMAISLRLLLKRYTAIYTNGQGESVGLLPGFLRRRQKWIHHHHTAGDAEDQKSWGKRYRQVLQKADIVIACSWRNANDVKIATDRLIEVIPCFSTQVKNISTSDKKSDHIRFGYYGRLIPEKGIDLICQLSEDPDLKNLEFHIWGEGAAYSKTFFERYPRVYYHGAFCGSEELGKVLGTIDALLLLSKHPEGLPISLLEAMSGGIPWLATDRGGIADIACDPKSTRVIPVSANYFQIKAAILSLASDLKAGLVSNSAQLEFYNSKFSSSTLVQQWQKVFEVDEN